MVTLYQLHQDMRALTQRMSDEADPDTGEIPEALFAELDALVAAEQDRLVDIACILKERRAEAEAIRDEAKRLADRARSVEAQCERMKQILEARVGLEGLTDPRVRARWRRSTAVEVSVPAETLPELYRRVKVEADKVGLGAALKAGAKIEGVALVERHGLIVQ